MALIITREDVERLLPMRDAIAAVARGFQLVSEGKVVMPARLATPVGDGVHLSMPCYVPGEALTVKVVTLLPGQPIRATVLLHDIATGEVLAIIDGESFTAIRTGAASGVATQHLARADAKVLTLFGAGTQAATQLEAVCAVRKVNQVFVVSLENAGPFCDRMSRKFAIDVAPAGDVKDAVEAADIICTATNSPTPVFRGEWLRPGTHINAIGAFTPATRELDTETIRRSKVLVDSRAASGIEAGDILIPRSQGVDVNVTEIGEVIMGKYNGRKSEDEITVFKSVGIAVQDALTAKLVFESKADRRGTGPQKN